MTDKHKAPGESQGSKRRKRAAPTIDLTATEVPPAEEAASPDAPLPEQAGAEQTQAEPAQAATSEPPTAEPEAPRQPGQHILLASITAGFAGAVIVFAVLAALWWSGMLPAASTGKDQSAQIAALQKQIKELQNRPAPAAATDGKAVEELRQSVLKLENDIAKLPRGDATMAARLTAIDKAMTALSVSIGSVNKRADDLAGKVDQAQKEAAAAQKAVADLRDSVQTAAGQATPAVEPAKLDALQKQFDTLQQQVASLDQSLKTARDKIAKTPAADKAARLALSALSLRAAVAGGHPYASELAQAKSLGADEKQLAPLERFAAAGLPGKATLARELRALIPALEKAAGAHKTPEGFLERLQANASKIVRISPVGAPKGDKAADVLARLELAAAHDDIAAALADLAKLPAAARQLAQQWIARAKTRAAALAAARQFAATAARALGQTGK